LFTCYVNSKEWIIIRSSLFINIIVERRRGGSSSFLFCFCIASSLCFYTPASLFLLLFLMVVVVLLSMVAQGSSCGGNKEGRQWCPPFSFMFLPSFCFLPSPFLSFSFFVLFPFVSFLFLSSMSLFLSLLSSSILKQPSPCQLSPRSPPFFTSSVSFSLYHPLCFKPFPQPSL